MSILTKIQQELKAPKNQRNNFGGYNYRSCEDILEALKPLLSENGATLTISDEIVMIGDRYYVKATAKFVAGEETHETSAYAREAENKKGMDESQITGTASSYARKYCLNGLFCIDDTKDADTDEHKKQTGNHEPRKGTSPLPASSAQLKFINSLMEKQGYDEATRKEALNKVKTMAQATEAIEKLKGKE